MRSRQVRRARLFGLLAVALVAVGLGVAGYATSLLRTLDLSTVDTRFSIRGTEPRPDDIVVVRIDDTHLQPAQAAVAVPAQRPRAPDRPAARRGREGDRLRRPVHRADRAPRGQRPGPRRRTRRRGRSLDHRSQRARRKQRLRRRSGGQADRRPRRATRRSSPTPAGCCARFPVSFDGLVGFATAAAEAAGSAPVDSGDAGGKYPWIDYRGPPGTIESYSFSKVLRGEVPKDAVRGKTVVVGASAPSLQDFHATPVGEGHEMPGAEVQANAIWTVAQRLPAAVGAGVPQRRADRPLRPGRARRAAAPAAAAGLRRRGPARPALRRLRPDRLRRGLDRHRRLPARGARPLRGRRARGHHPDHRLRAPAGARHLRPLRPRVGRQRRPRPRRRGPAPGRRAPRGRP